MDARQIAKWDRCRELAEECGINIDVGLEFHLRGQDGLAFGTFDTIDNLFNYLCGYTAASSTCKDQRMEEVRTLVWCSVCRTVHAKEKTGLSSDCNVWNWYSVFVAEGVLDPDLPVQEAS